MPTTSKLRALFIEAGVDPAEVEVVTTWGYHTKSGEHIEWINSEWADKVWAAKMQDVKDEN